MAKVRGLNVFLKVNTGTVGSPTWTKVGGQKDATFDRGRATIDTTDKDSSGNEEHLASTRNWAFSFDAFLVEDDAGFLEVETAYDANTLKQFQFVTPGFTYMGTASVESLSVSGALGDASVASFSLKGSGALAKAAV